MSKQPVHKITFGLIHVAIWKNEGSKGTFYNVTVTRSYKDGEEWKESQSYGRDDLPLVSKALDQAHTWIFQEAP